MLNGKLMERNYSKNRELFSAVSHEIKNSLNPVINLSTVLKRNAAGRLTADENSYLDAIERNGKRILNLVEEYSFLNRLTGRGKKSVPVPVDVHEMIHSSVTGMAELNHKSECRIVCEYGDGAESIFIDEALFRKILESLSLFFISTGGDRPSLFFRSEITGLNFVLTVSHNKPDAPVIVDEKFESEDAVEKGVSRSSLMWLQFAAVYIDYLHGESFFRYGAEGDMHFLFSIPASKGDGSIINVSSEFDAGTGHDVTGEFLVLVIDDDSDSIIPVNAIVENEFAGKGRVLHAESGMKGLDLLEKTTPDLILLDLTLPDINGLSLVRNIKNHFINNRVPVIAFTGLEISGDRDKLIRSGFDDIIEKPFSVDAFIRKIRKWIN